MAAVPPAPRFENINLLRAFAALSVVTYHVIEHAQWASFPISGPLAAFRFGWYGVDLFFVVSGFVIAYSALTLYRRDAAGFRTAYWARRLTRILPLYLVTLVMWIALFAPGFFSGPPAEWIAQLASHLTFTHSFWTSTHGAIDGPNWSLAIEMQFYLLVALAIPWLDRAPGWAIWLGFTLVAWAWRAAMLHAYSGEPSYVVFVKTTQLPGTLDLFGAGIFAAKWVLGGGELTPARGLAWMAGAVAAAYTCIAVLLANPTYWDLPGMVIFWRSLLALVFLCMLLAAINLPCALARRWLRPLDYLGEVSYGIYLWHLFAITIAITLLGKDAPRVFIAVMTATLVLAAVSWNALEKPFMRLARR